MHFPCNLISNARTLIDSCRKLQRKLKKFLSPPRASRTLQLRDCRNDAQLCYAASQLLTVSFFVILYDYEYSLYQNRTVVLYLAWLLTLFYVTHYFRFHQLLANSKKTLRFNTCTHHAEFCVVLYHVTQDVFWFSNFSLPIAMVPMR